MKYTFTAAATSPSFAPSDPGSHWQAQAWHLYASGVWGAAGSLNVQISPDGANVSDANSRWFTLSAVNVTLPLTAAGDAWFQARFRKIRYVFSGGDGTTNVVVEVV